MLSSFSTPKGKRYYTYGAMYLSRILYLCHCYGIRCWLTLMLFCCDYYFVVCRLNPDMAISFCNNLIEYICNVCKCMKLSHYSFLTWLLMCGLKWEIAGGTFALYSLLCKHSQVGILPSRRVESNLGLEHATQYVDKHNRLRNFFEQSMIARRALLFIAMLGTCMLIGDGILTPAISGL